MEDAKVQKQFELEQRSDKRERLKKERERGKAKKAAERECQKTDNEAAKACHATQKLKREAPQVPYPKNRTSVRNNLGAVHQRLQSQKLNRCSYQGSHHGSATSLFQANLDSTK
jgi:hypothetical protein